VLDVPLRVQIAPKIGGYALSVYNARGACLHVSSQDPLAWPDFPDVDMVQAHIRETPCDRMGQLPYIQIRRRTFEERVEGLLHDGDGASQDYESD